MTAMQRSGSRALSSIGKGAAITDVTIRGYKSAANAMAWGTSIGGPPLGLALAAAVSAWTLEQLSALSGVKLFDGGTVLARNARASRYRDSVPAQLAVGETVISRDLTEKLSKSAGETNQQIDQSIHITVEGNIIADDDEQVDNMISRINERVETYNGRLVSTATAK